MRELKFRTWDKKRKCYAKHIMTTNTSCPYHDRMNMFKGVMTFAKWVLRRYVIEQYTGLKDKNGKEIYEGDIVSEHQGDIIGTIIQNPSGEYRIAWIGIFGGESVLYEHRSLCEVIGNIHENPGLLVEAKNVD